jgi:hypothetical protein
MVHRLRFLAVAVALLFQPIERAVADFDLASLKGRRIWVTNGTRQECARLMALGMRVDCELDRPSALGERDIIIRCTQIPHAAAAALLKHLGLSGFEIITHQTSQKNDAECGKLFEITLRH